jgi:hypothetical protein
MEYVGRAPVIHLTFAGTPLAGLEADLSLGFGILERVLVPSDFAALSDEDMLALLSDHLVSWNLTDSAGRPVPPTAESILGQDVAFIIAVFARWREALMDHIVALSRTRTPEYLAALSGGICAN